MLVISGSSGGISFQIMQSDLTIFQGESIGNTSIVLTTDASPPTNLNTLSPPINTVYSFLGELIALNKANGEKAIWEITGYSQNYFDIYSGALSSINEKVNTIGITVNPTLVISSYVGLQVTGVVGDTISWSFTSFIASSI